MTFLISPGLKSILLFCTWKRTGKFPAAFASNRIVTNWFATVVGSFLVTCGVPPNPVTLQKRSYKGTEAKDNPSMIKKIKTKYFGCKILNFAAIIKVYQKFHRLYYK